MTNWTKTFVREDETIRQVMLRIDAAELQIALVVDEKCRLRGVITDGDLRRLMERDSDPLRHLAGEVMQPGGICIPADEFASAALRLLEERRITSLMITDGEGRVEGVLHLHDLWGVGLF